MKPRFRLTVAGTEKHLLEGRGLPRHSKRQAGRDDLQPRSLGDLHRGRGSAGGQGVEGMVGAATGGPCRAPSGLLKTRVGGFVQSWATRLHGGSWARATIWCGPREATALARGPPPPVRRASLSEIRTPDLELRSPQRWRGRGSTGSLTEQVARVAPGRSPSSRRTEEGWRTSAAVWRSLRPVCDLTSQQRSHDYG